MAEAAAGMSVLAATNSAVVAGVDEAIPVACITVAGTMAVDVAAGAEDHSMVYELLNGRSSRETGSSPGSRIESYTTW
eukprot:5570814-Pleurochrysis_carterae.AAC.2